MKCDHCGDEVKPNCDWRQGRCPHLPPMIDNYQARFYNLIQFIKNLFKPKGDCDCGHKH
jgi:hypothetical protein